MPRKITWTEAQDVQIRRLRAEGRTWDEIGAAMGLTRWTVIERGRRVGAKPPPPDFVPAPPDPNRDPLPAGSPVTWAAITQDTVLAGVPFKSFRPR
jgi:hypothetical protein